MKKALLLNIAVVAGIILMSSCERNYTCICVYPGSTISTSKTTFKAKRRSEAETACSRQHTGAMASGGSCALE